MTARAVFDTVCEMIKTESILSYKISGFFIYRRQVFGTDMGGDGEADAGIRGVKGTACQDRRKRGGKGMDKTFEERLADIQGKMILACMDYAGNRAERIYIYASRKAAVPALTFSLRSMDR